MTKIQDIRLPKGVAFTNGWVNGEEVCLAYRSESGSRRVLKVYPDWYFYVRGVDYRANFEVFKEMKRRRWIKGAEYNFTNNEYVKIFCRNQNLSRGALEDGKMDQKTRVVREMRRRGVPTFEADLSPLQRLMVDREVEIASRYKTLYLDIETKDTDDRGRRVPIQHTLDGEQPILAVAFEFSNGVQKYVVAPREWDIERGEMYVLEKTIALMKKADIVVGFNSNQRDGFDLPVIKKRMEVYDLHFPWRTIIDIDIQRRLQKTHAFNLEIARYSLDYLAEYFLGERKVTHEGLTMWEMWLNHRDLLKEYALKDIRLTRLLDVEEEIIRFMIRQCQICGVFLSNFYTSTLIDGYVLREGMREGKPLPTARKDNVKTEKFKGAVVLDPVPGLYENVYVFDFKSLYPSLIRTFNIGNDTIFKDVPPMELDKALTTVEGKMEDWRERGLIKSAKCDVYFDPTEESVLAKTVRKFLAERARCRKEMKKYPKDSHEYKKLDLEQSIWKIMANSTYGITGSPHTRYFSQDVAESITRGGRAVHGHTKDWFEAHGCMVIYGDTDSVFIQIPKGTDVDALVDKFHAEFPAILKEHYNCPTSYIELEYEKWYTTMFVGMKKFYGGMHVDAGADPSTAKFKGKGLDKREWVGIVRDVLKKLCEHVVKKANKVGPEFYARWLNKIREKVLYGPIPREAVEKYIVHKRVTKNPSDYANQAKLPITVQVFQDLQRIGRDVNVGQVMQLIHVIPDGNRTGREDALDYQMFLDSGRELHRQYYWDVRIYRLLAKVLKAVFPDYDWDQFDSTVVVSRAAVLAQFRKDIESPRKFLSVRNRLRTANLSNEQKEDILREIDDRDPDINTRLKEDAQKWIRKRSLVYVGAKTTDEITCGYCGGNNHLTGIVSGRIHTNRATLCLDCSYEKKTRITD